MKNSSKNRRITATTANRIISGSITTLNKQLKIFFINRLSMYLLNLARNAERIFPINMPEFRSLPGYPGILRVSGRKDETFRGELLLMTIAIAGQHLPELFNQENEIPFKRTKPSHYWNFLGIDKFYFFTHGTISFFQFLIRLMLQQLATASIYLKMNCECDNMKFFSAQFFNVLFVSLTNCNKEGYNVSTGNNCCAMAYMTRPNRVFCFIQSMFF